MKNVLVSTTKHKSQLLAAFITRYLQSSFENILSQLARETCLAECEAKLTECLIECNSDISCTSSCNREYAQCEHRGRQFWFFILFKNVVETSRRNSKGNEGHDSVKHQCQTFHFNFVHWNFSSSRKIFNMF